MPTDPEPVVRPLPDRPDLRHLKNQARDLDSETVKLLLAHAELR